MMFLSKWKKAMLSLAVLAGAYQVGCTDRELGAGIAGAMIGAVLVDSAHRAPPPPPRSSRCHVESRRYCRVTQDYYGRPYESCTYRQWDTCGGYWRKANLTANSSNELDMNDVAETYQLSADGSSKLIAALSMAQAAQNDDVAREAFAQIGVSLDEMRALGQNGNPSDDMIDRMAKALNQAPSMTKMMVNSILETARAQQAARTQPDAA